MNNISEQINLPLEWPVARPDLMKILSSHARAINDASAATTAIAGRNRLINGDMQIDQRLIGVAGNFTTSNVYGLDRWAMSAGTAVSGTLQYQRINNGPQTGYAMHISRSSGTYAGGLNAVQVIETSNCLGLAGQSVTLSYKARKGSSFSGSFSSTIHSGTGADEGSALINSWTGGVSSTDGNILTSAFQSFSQTTTLGELVLEVGVRFSSGNFSGTGDANDWIEITDVQLELGAGTVFERREIGLELAMAQRYYEKSYNIDAALGSANPSGSVLAIVGVAGVYNHTIGFRVTKRTTPTMLAYNYSTGATGSWRDTSAAANRTATWVVVGYSSATVELASTVLGNQVAGAWSADAEL